MSNVSGLKILITGGSSGIGKATAQLFTSLGAVVAITGRDKKKLEKVAQEIKAIPIHLDVTKYTTFHPNTIMYAIPKGTPLEKQISKAKIGIVWHTRYKGASFETMSAEFGVEIVSKLKKTSKVWQVDATLPQQEGAVLDAADTKAVTLALSNAGKIFKKIASKTLKEIEEDSELNLLINTFNNTKVRAAERITDPKKHVSDLISWVNQRYYKQKLQSPLIRQSNKCT